MQRMIDRRILLCRVLEDFLDLNILRLNSKMNSMAKESETVLAMRTKICNCNVMHLSCVFFLRQKQWRLFRVQKDAHLRQKQWRLCLVRMAAYLTQKTDTAMLYLMKTADVNLRVWQINWRKSAMEQCLLWDP